MAEKARCEICDRTFKDEWGLSQHNEHKHAIKATTEKEGKPMNLGKYKGWIIFIVIAGVLIWGVMWLSSLGTTLPPTDMVGHIEVNPPSHVMKVPMRIEIHKHMLEHVDGEEGGRGGIIINYNCEQYECEAGLIEKLEAFTESYNYVYVAPFKNMDAKIALTRLNRQTILEEFDEIKIETFITGPGIIPLYPYILISFPLISFLIISEEIV